MSVFSIKNRFLDGLDPFWLCRTLALKAGVTAILLFLCNAFLSSSASPVVFMLTTTVAVVISEVLPSKSRWQKFGNFFAVVILLSFGGIFFGLLSYLKITLFLFVMCFTYVVLRFMVKNAASAALSVLVLCWGYMQLEGGAATNFTTVGDNLLYYFEFSLMGAITIALFPDLTPNIFKSAFIRILESDHRNIGNHSYRNSQPAVLTALGVIRSKLPMLPESYAALYESIVVFQADFMRSHHLTEQQAEQAKAVLSELAQAVSNKTRFADPQNYLQQASEQQLPGCDKLRHLIDTYDQCVA